MAEGIVSRKTDRGFGFIDSGKDRHLLLHMSAVGGVSFGDLGEGQRVSHVEGMGEKGPCAENCQAI